LLGGRKERMGVTVDELQARADIMDVVHAYAEAVDTKDWDAWANAFTPEASIDYTASGGAKGNVSEMFKWIASTFKLFSASQHMLTNFQFVFRGHHNPDLYLGQESRKCEVTVKLYNPMAIKFVYPVPFFYCGGSYFLSMVDVGNGKASDWKIAALSQKQMYITVSQTVIGLLICAAVAYLLYCSFLP